MNSSEPSGFVRVAGLYAKTSRAGNPLLFGRWGRLRVYAFPVTHSPKDCAPDYWLCVRAEDYNVRRDGPAQPTDTSHNHTSEDS